MLFPTVDFALFFALVFLGHWLLEPEPRALEAVHDRGELLLLRVVERALHRLLAAASTVICQLGGDRGGAPGGRARRTWTMGDRVAATLAPLAVLQVLRVLLGQRDERGRRARTAAQPPLIQVVLPIGVSFYTFMAISYVVDVYRRQFAVASWIDVFLYLSFFPHLVAGPIVRPEELIPQLDVRRDARHVDVVGAAWLILGGLFKKVVIANYLATAIVDPVFGEPARHGCASTSSSAWSPTPCRSTATSAATPTSRSGSPSSSGSSSPRTSTVPTARVRIQDFWRRWHMTLSRWLRDYLYIPLGGNRKGDRAHLREPHDHDAAGRAVARGGLALRRLGSAYTGSIW